MSVLRLKYFLFPVLFVCLVLSACAVQTQEKPLSVMSPTGTVRLTNYSTRTATVTPTPPDPATPTPFPTSTATPRTHVVQQGEDLFGIALRYGITLDELTAANPDVDPNLMSVDTVLLIPASNQAAEPDGMLPTPTAAGALLASPICYRSAEGGLWCFAWVENISGGNLESVSALFRLADSEGIQVTERTGLPPLNLIRPGGGLPVVVYFPPPVPFQYQVNAVLLTAFPAETIEQRYLTAEINNLQVEISPDGLSAKLTGQISLPKDSAPAGQVWLAAVAYDVSGKVVGVRRWESALPLNPNSTLPFLFSVYSLDTAIVEVQVSFEARP